MLGIERRSLVGLGVVEWRRGRQRVGSGGEGEGWWRRWRGALPCPQFHPARQDGFSGPEPCALELVSPLCSCWTWACGALWLPLPNRVRHPLGSCRRGGEQKIALLAGSRRGSCPAHHKLQLWASSPPQQHQAPTQLPVSSGSGTANKNSPAAERSPRKPSTANKAGPGQRLQSPSNPFPGQVSRG